MFRKRWKAVLSTGLALLVGTSLVACDNNKEASKHIEKKVVQPNQSQQSVFFKDKKVTIDYSKSPEEILANYTVEGMNEFKVNFPDTLSMDYALKNIGKPAPEISGKTLDGKQVSLSSLKGKKVVISFSKTTCSICQGMEPIVSDIAKSHSDIVFLHVYPVDQNKDIQAFYKSLKEPVPANVLSLENNKSLKNLAINDYQITQVPTYVFVDESGRISYTYIGNKDKQMFEDMLSTAFGNEKLYNNLRTITIRVDKNGNEIKEEKLVTQSSVVKPTTTTNPVTPP